jgi:hypothetical protein
MIVKDEDFKIITLNDYPTNKTEELKNHDIECTSLCPNCLTDNIEILVNQTRAIWPYVKTNEIIFEDVDCYGDEFIAMKCLDCDYEIDSDQIDLDELVVIIDFTTNIIYIHENLYDELKKYHKDNEIKSAILNTI